jgi:hypothetical protein
VASSPGFFIGDILSRPAGKLSNRENTNLAVVQLVEIARRLHDRLEVRPRIKRVEQLRGVRN